MVMRKGHRRRYRGEQYIVVFEKFSPHRLLSFLFGDKRFLKRQGAHLHLSVDFIPNFSTPLQGDLGTCLLVYKKAGIAQAPHCPLKRRQNIGVDFQLRGQHL